MTLGQLSRRARVNIYSLDGLKAAQKVDPDRDRRSELEAARYAMREFIVPSIMSFLPDPNKQTTVTSTKGSSVRCLVKSRVEAHMEDGKIEESKFEFEEIGTL
jgi:hypothetical protein